MKRYKTSGNIEAQFEPGSKVLRNKQGIRSNLAIDRLELESLRKTQVHFFDSVTPKTRLSNDLICRMHKHFMGRIYSWAGRYRTVNLSKPGFVWPPAYLVSQNMDQFEKGVLRKYTPCRPGPIERVAKDIAVVHAEFLLIHPFREGNGRIARLIADIMALQAGYPPLEFGFISRDKQREYIAAVKRGYLGDYRKLAGLMIEAMRRSGEANERV